MSAEPTAWSLDSLLSFEMEEALTQLRNDLPGKKSREELFAHHIRQVDQLVCHKPGGIIEISTHIIASRRQDDQHTFHRYAVGTPHREGGDH